jgi:5-hydroxyisourate hydrolase
VSGISTHILDISRGRPAGGLQVKLEQSDGDDWHEIATQITDDDGRVKQLLPVHKPLEKGKYRLTFHTQAYFDTRGVEGLYPVVQVTITVANSAGHYHIPLLLTANGYSTYRGS